MKAKPVRKYKAPAYPTRLEVLSDPGLLEDNLPPGWRLKPELAGAVAIFLAANGCVNAGDKDLPVGNEAAVVAPIFEHGEGRGATGCVVVSPPVFLSEEEALQIINEELTKAGIEVTEKDVTLKGVKIRERTREYRPDRFWRKGGPRIVKGKAEPLSVDIVDKERGVAAEFVSARDYAKLGGITCSMGTVGSFDFKEAAEGVADAVGKQGEGVYFGVLYDPLPKVDWERPDDDEDREAANKRLEEARAQAELEARRLLRAQVEDFVAWLQGQGVV